MLNWMLVAIKCIGVGWILLTFFIVLHSYISLVNGGKDHSLCCLVLRLPGYLSELHL